MAGKKKKNEKLSTYLEDLSEDHVNKLATTLEYKRLKGEDEADQDLILDSIRPVLAQSLNPAPRLMTPMRLFCIPFESLLYPGDVSHKLSGRIARASLMPIWTWLETEVMPGRIQQLVDRIKTSILDGNREEIDSYVGHMQKEVGEELGKLLDPLVAGTDGYRGLGSLLGDERIIEDARDIACTLKITPFINEVMQHFPQPFANISDKDIEVIRDIYERAESHENGSGGIIFSVLMGRLSQGWDILPVILEATSADSDVLFGSGPLGQPGALLAHDASRLATYFETVPVGSQAPQDILENLSYFVQLVGGIFEGGEIDCISSAGKLLEQYRRTVANNIERVLEQIPPLMRAATPSTRIGGFGEKAKTRPDISQWPDQDKVNIAVNQAILFGGISSLAKNEYFEPFVEGIRHRIERQFQMHNESLLEEIRAVDGEDRERAMAHCETSILLMRYIFGDEPSEEFREKINIVSAAA